MKGTDRLTRRRFLGAAAAGAAALGLGASCASPHGGSGGWEIGCYTRPWAAHDYRTALDAVAEAGFRHVGLMTTKSKHRLVLCVGTTIEEAAEAGAEAKKRGLAVASAYGGGIPVQKSLEEGIAALKGLIDKCAAAECRSLLMGGIGKQELYDPYYKAIAECCDYAAEKKVGIALKPHGGLNATGTQVRKTVESVGHPNFRIWYDPGNIYYYSEGKIDPVEEADTVAGLVNGMCVKDYKHPKDVAVTPGTGMVKWPALMARLRKGGFTGGPLVVETLADGDLPKLLQEARAARKFLAELTG